MVIPSSLDAICKHSLKIKQNTDNMYWAINTSTALLICKKGFSFEAESFFSGKGSR